MPEKPPEQRPESEPLFPDDFAARPVKKTDAAERRPRRASPLGLMGTAESELPRASGWPSLRAVGIMAAVMALVLLLIFLVTRK